MIDNELDPSLDTYNVFLWQEGGRWHAGAQRGTYPMTVGDSPAEVLRSLADQWPKPEHAAPHMEMQRMQNQINALTIDLNRTLRGEDRLHDDQYTLPGSKAPGFPHKGR